MRSFLFYLLWVVCCLTILSCKEKEDDGIDRSLAGSVSMLGYKMEVEGSYGGEPLSEFRYNTSLIGFIRVTDRESSFTCSTTWDNTFFSVSISPIPLKGVPYDVSFDYSCTDASVRTNDSEFKESTAIISGWIKRPDMLNIPSPKMSLVRPDYLCDITLESIVEGKELILHIKAVHPY